MFPGASTNPPSGGRSPSPIIPPGVYRVTRELDDRLRAACSAPVRREGEGAHPGFAFVAALAGMGLKVGDICRLVGLSLESGAVLGTCRIRYDRPLEVDRTYQVQGRVGTLVRKASRRFGATDHLMLHMEVGAASVPFAQVELTMIVPVREAA